MFPDGTLQMTAAARGAPVEDTGQTGCWQSDGTPRSCAGTGEDGEYLAGVAWPTPRLTDNGDGTVTDNLTALIWLQDAECFGAKDWQPALDQIALFNGGSTACTNYTAAAFTDWRLPNAKEILSLFDYGEDDSLPFGHPFIDVVQHYWSSTTWKADPTWAYNSNHGKGIIHMGPKIGDPVWVWPVRGGQ